MPLTSVNFCGCKNLTNNALEHLKGMPLKNVSFRGCPNLTDKALEHLKGMPLTSVNFSWCHKLTDKALEHLKGMPLTSVEFSDCPNLTDNALDHLKGMLLTSVSFRGCPESYRQCIGRTRSSENCLGLNKKWGQNKIRLDKSFALIIHILSLAILPILFSFEKYNRIGRIASSRINRIMEDRWVSV